jgi:hypothetical protein
LRRDDQGDGAIDKLAVHMKSLTASASRFKTEM